MDLLESARADWKSGRLKECSVCGQTNLKNAEVALEKRFNAQLGFRKNVESTSPPVIERSGVEMRIHSRVKFVDGSEIEVWSWPK